MGSEQMRHLLLIAFTFFLIGVANAVEPYVLHFDIPAKPVMQSLGNPPFPDHLVNECSRLRLVFDGPIITSSANVIEARVFDDDGDWVDLQSQTGLAELDYSTLDFNWFPNQGRLEVQFLGGEHSYFEFRRFHVFPSITDLGDESHWIDFGAPAFAEFEIQSCYEDFQGMRIVFDCGSDYYDMTPVMADPNGKDIDGDGKSDLLWRNQANGRTNFNRMDGLVRLETLSTNFHLTSLGWKAIGIGDFDGDRYADILWRRRSDGKMKIYFMKGRELLESVDVNFTPSTQWEVRAIADFNLDGRSDIYMWNSIIGSHRIHHMNGAARVGLGISPGYRILDTNWQPIGAGDFDGDGTTDLMYQNIVTGRHNAHFLDANYERIGNHATGAPLPGGILSQQAIGPFLEGQDPGLLDAGVADMNRDGIADVISRNLVTGRVFFHHVLWGAEPFEVPSASPFTLGQLDWQLRAR